MGYTAVYIHIKPFNHIRLPLEKPQGIRNGHKTKGPDKTYLYTVL